MLDERLSGGDKVKSLSNKEIKKLRKERADKSREKFDLSDKVDDKDILLKEGQIAQAQEKAVHDTEEQYDQAEGNISENLIQALESGSDGDISSALNSAQTYHKSSDDKAKQTLKQRAKNYVQKLFAA